MESDSIKARLQSLSRSRRCLRRSIGVAALLGLAFGATLPAPVAAADREALYSKAEDLIRYTDDVKGLSALIAQGVDVKKPGKNSQGRTLLISAATEGKVPMMDVLLKAGADPNAKDESGMTALRQVAWTGKNPVGATKRLIAAKADVNIVANDNWTPLIQVMYADPGVAVPVAQLLLHAGADASIVNNEGNTALILAADRGMPVLIPALVKGGADVNARGRDGTALGLAAEKGQTAVVKALLLANADPNLGNKDNQTPLMKAAQRDQVEIIPLLLAYCARTDLTDSFFKWNAMKFAKSDAAKSALQASKGANCK
jgi:ankyrin repeat protein